ncbi:hypothetical protein EBT25_16140, partial [bacterium]|nr:hypothetical protein [bacterium]
TIPSISAIVGTGLHDNWNTAKYVRYVSATYDTDPYQGLIIVPKRSFSDYFILKYSSAELLPSMLDNTLQNTEFQQKYQSVYESVSEVQAVMSHLPQEGDVIRGSDDLDPKNQVFYAVRSNQLVTLKPPQTKTLDYIAKMTGVSPYAIDLGYASDIPISTASSNYYPSCLLQNNHIYKEPGTSGNAWFIQNDQKHLLPASVLSGKPALFPVATSAQLSSCPTSTPVTACATMEGRMYQCARVRFLDSNYIPSSIINDITTYRNIHSGVSYTLSANQYVAAGSPVVYGEESCELLDAVCASPPALIGSNMGKPSTKPIIGGKSI